MAVDGLRHVEAFAEERGMSHTSDLQYRPSEAAF